MDLDTFGKLVNAFDSYAFPTADSNDLSNGAGSIPGEVTDARRKGEKVVYNKNTKTWTFKDGSTVQ